MKVAVIGCGSMGRRRIQHLQVLEVDTIVVYDIRKNRMDDAVKKYNVHAVASVESLIKENPLAIFICVPPSEHMFYINTAIDNNWNIMTEQPVSHQYTGLDLALAQIKKKKLVNHVSCNKRFHPAINRIKEFISDGVIGQPIAGLVEIGEWLPDWHPYEPYTDYYPSRKDMGGGLDAICDLDWLICLFGVPSRLACLASKRSTLEIDTDDVVQITLDFDRGPQVVLHTDMIQRTFSNTIKFIGDQGTLTWARQEHVFHVFRKASGEWETLPEEQPDAGLTAIKPGWEWVESMYFDDTLDFMNRLRSGDSSTKTFESGMMNLQIVLQALSLGHAASVVNGA